MSEDRTHQLELERAALGEVETKPKDRDQVEALRRENAEFLERHPSARVAAEIERRRQERRRVAPWRVAIPALAMVAVVAIVVRQPPTDHLEVTRSKGHVQLLVHRAAASGPEKLSDGEVARPGDRLQLGYGPGGQGYAVIASIDGAGAITVHLPKSKDDEAARLDPKGAALPFSYELDRAPRIERFFLVTRAEPFAARQVEEAIRSLTQPDTEVLRLPPGFEQTSLLLRKVAP
jgi:hypothetical protein